MMEWVGVVRDGGEMRGRGNLPDLTNDPNPLHCPHDTNPRPSEHAVIRTHIIEICISILTE